MGRSNVAAPRGRGARSRRASLRPITPPARVLDTPEESPDVCAVRDGCVVTTTTVTTAHLGDHPGVPILPEYQPINWRLAMRRSMVTLALLAAPILASVAHGQARPSQSEQRGQHEDARKCEKSVRS